MANKRMKNGYPFIPYSQKILSEERALQIGEEFYKELETRRSIRSFSDKEVPQKMIEQAILCASTAPSGAHRQPWKFVAIQNKDIKRRIRLAAEEEERRN